MKLPCGCTVNKFPPDEIVEICDEHMKQAVKEGEEISKSISARIKKMVIRRF
jgi:hypothetical protein